MFYNDSSCSIEKYILVQQYCLTGMHVMNVKLELQSISRKRSQVEKLSSINPSLNKVAQLPRATLFAADNRFYYMIFFVLKYIVYFWVIFTSYFSHTYTCNSIGQLAIPMDIFQAYVHENGNLFMFNADSIIIYMCSIKNMYLILQGILHELMQKGANIAL